MKHLAIVALVLWSVSAIAEKAPEPGPIDPRVRTITYSPRDVVQVVGHYGYLTTISFSEAEVIEVVTIGDSVAWQVDQNRRDNMLFLKPTELNARTNLTVVTTRPHHGQQGYVTRAYNFALDATETESPPSEDMTWALQFRYPEDERAIAEQRRERDALTRSALTEPELEPLSPEAWSFRYSYSGDRELVPRLVFDNGQFTYFEFRDELDSPAIFLVEEAGGESLVNTTRKGRYVVVHRVGTRFTLRSGKLVTCIYNDGLKGSAPSVNGPELRRKRGLFKRMFSKKRS